MKKISIIYFSNYGNVEVLANAIAKGAETAGVQAEVTVKLVSEAKPEDVFKADAVAFGSPSLYNNQIDQKEMAPFIDQFKLTLNNNKPIVLFGSYGWDEGKFMEDWASQMKDYKFNVLDTLAVKETPDEAQLKKAEELGKLLCK
jgi:flavodoxin short chain